MSNQVDKNDNNLGIITDSSDNFLGFIIDNSNNITTKKTSTDENAQQEQRPVLTSNLIHLKDAETSLEEGVKIESNYRGRGRWYSSTISRVNANGTFDIKYDDGDREQGVERKLIRLKDGYVTRSWYSRPKNKNPIVDSDDDSSIDNEEISKYSNESLVQSRIAALPVITNIYNTGSNALATLSEFKKDDGYETNSGSEMGNEQWDKMIKETEISNEERNRRRRPYVKEERRNRLYDKLLSDYQETSDSSDGYRHISKSMLMGILSQIDIPRYEIDEIKKYVNDVFTTNLVTLTSTHLDMIGSYLNSQKMIYTESSYYTSTWLNYLMIPTIIISAGASVISGIEDQIPHAPLIISCITAFSAFLLSVINYLKLDAASEAHKISAHQYDKLHSHIMFFSGKSLLFSPASFNFNTRASREAKKKLEANKTVRNMLDDERSKSNTAIENIKKEYKLERASLDKEIQSLKEEYSLLENQLNNEKNKIRRKEMHDILIRQDSSKAKLETLDNNYQKDREAESKKIDRFYEDLRQLRTEQEEEALIQLNSEETKLQEDLMNDILKEIDDVQKKINEIKETNQFEVPKTIRNRYPTAYNINVFSLIKMIEGYKFILTIKLWIYRNQKRQMRYYIEKCCSIIEEFNLKRGVKSMIEEEIVRFRALKNQYNDKINIIYESMVAISVAYIEIDGMLQSEFEQGETKKFLGPLYYIFPCLLRLFHDLSWYDTTLIKHVYMSAGETRKKLSHLDTKSRSRIKNFLYSNADEMV
jgi:hypothetical protein